MNTNMSAWELGLTILVWSAVVVVFFYYRHRAIAEYRERDAATRRPAPPQPGAVPPRDLSTASNSSPGPER
jgi:hypothetical protein